MAREKKQYMSTFVQFRCDVDMYCFFSLSTYRDLSAVSVSSEFLNAKYGH